MGEEREGGRERGEMGEEGSRRKREGKNIRRKICATKYPEQIVWL